MDDVTRRTMLWGAGASVAATGLVQKAAARQDLADRLLAKLRIIVLLHVTGDPRG